MNVTMVSPPPYNTSGVGKYTENLISPLGKFINLKRIYLPANCTNPLSFLKTAFKTGHRDSDVIHVQYDYVLFGRASLMTWIFFPCLMVISHLQDIAVVITIHDAIHETQVEKPLTGLKAWYIHFLNSLLITCTDRRIFLSQQTEDRFRKSVDPTPTHQIPHGVKSKDRIDNCQSGAKKEFGYIDEEKLVVEPGFISPRKGSDVFAALAKELPEYEFMLAGGRSRDKHGEFIQKLQARAPPNLRVTGVLDDYRYELAICAADLVVLPYQELSQAGIQNKIVQSGVLNDCIGSRTPVAASDIGYFAQIETEWGCVRTFDENNISSVARTVEILIVDKQARDQLIESMQYFEKENSFKTVAEAHTEIYQKALSD